MPYEVIYFKKGHDGQEHPHYMLKKLKDDKIIKNKHFRTKLAAINMAKAMMRFRKEDPIVKGNKILDKNKIKKK